MASPEEVHHWRQSIQLMEKVYCAVPTEPPEELPSAPLAQDGEALADGFQVGSVSIFGQAQISACIAMGKAIDILGGHEEAGSCAVEKESVYGAAVAIPQVARSARWPTSMCTLVLRTYLFVLLNYFAQTLFIYYIYDSQNNGNAFSGQMHVCDFASHISNCPEGSNCVGPGGTPIYDPGTLYLFDIWYTRGFLRDSLQALFPERADEIGEVLNPVIGEYGVESYYCRLLCIFVFVLQIADEFQNIRQLCKTLRLLPREEAKESPWVQYKPPAEPCIDDPHGLKSLKCVYFAVNGMPRRWKIFNVLFLVIPRVFIWRMVTMAGVHFLMETAPMVDQIVNTTALSFVLTTDELILERLAAMATKHIMSNLKDYQLFDYSTLEGESDELLLERYNTHEMSWCGAHQFPMIPNRLVWTSFFTLLFVIEYYYHNCKRSENGGWVSNDLYLPENAHLDWWYFVTIAFGWEHTEGELNIWSMS